MGRKSKVSKDDVMQAVLQLQKDQQEVTIPAVRRFIGEDGSNTTIRTLILECQEEIKAQQAAMKKLTPSQAALASRLIENAVAQITAEVEADARKEIDECKAKALAEASSSKKSADLAWAEVDERVRERDDARDTIETLNQAIHAASERAARAEGQMQQQAGEIDRLRMALERSVAAKDQACTEAAELRGKLSAKAEREQEIEQQLAAAKAALARGRK